MARPITRQGLVDYCLRALGEPVLEVNVDPDQIDDRVDQAIQYFLTYNSDGIERTYIPIQITPEVIREGFVPVGDDIVQVLRVMPLGALGNTALNMFDVTYQMMLDASRTGFLMGGDMAYFEQMQQHLSLLDMKLNGTPQFHWTRYNNRLNLFGDTNDGDMKVGDIIVVEAYIEVRPDGPNASPLIYDDMFIKEYTTALIKQQWGMNLIKFEGVQLPGGITLNGRQLYDDATADIERLQERLRLEFEAPVDFFVG